MKKKLQAFFRKNPTAKLKTKEVAKKLGIKKARDHEKLKYFLHQLVEENFIEKVGKRYRLNKIHPGRLRGKLSLVDEGNYGFVILENSTLGDIFVVQRNMGTALNGDTVEVSLFANKKGKNLEGEIVNVVQRKRKEIIGTLRKSGSFYVLIPDESDIHRDIYIDKEHLQGASDGDKVAGGSIEWESQDLNPEGKVKEILGKAGTYNAELAAIAKEFGLAYRFPNGVLRQAKEIPVEIPPEELEYRSDFREKTVFTIDPADAKDFDDALSIEKLPNSNFSVGIHIADVSHFVEEDSPLYKEAEQRGTSVYFVGKVIPMLPEKLSNRVCSLVPGEDRLTFSIIAELTPEGGLVSYKIDKSVINSKRRYSYEEVQEIIENQTGENFEKINDLNNLAQILRKTRIESGSINFYTPEVQFELDDNGKPLNAYVKKIKESHQLVEESMLLANKIIARHLNKENKDNQLFVYRVHDLPDEEKVRAFSAFVKSLGYSFDSQQAKNPKQMQKLLESVEGKEEEAVVNEIAIRTMAKAIYSTKNIGHYGLGFDYYTHFTSPIRRFPDLIVHKLLWRYINKEKLEFTNAGLENICEHSSTQERNAVEAERLSIKIKQLEYLKDMVGEEFNGVISGITHFGMFVGLSHNLAEGLVRLSDMNDDFYIWEEKQYRLIGKHTEKVYRLGDKVKVQLIRVDEDKREIDFLIVD